MTSDDMTQKSECGVISETLYTTIAAFYSLCTIAQLLQLQMTLTKRLYHSYEMTLVVVEGLYDYTNS